MISSFKMEQYCVLCLKQDIGIPFSDFSLPINESSSVFECYQLLTSINFNNEFNAKICDNCLQNLTIFYKFRCQAIKNYDTIVSWKIDGKTFYPGN